MIYLVAFVAGFCAYWGSTTALSLAFEWATNYRGPGKGHWLDRKVIQGWDYLGLVSSAIDFLALLLGLVIFLSIIKG